MFMDSETAKAWAEQQAREIKNIKAAQKGERKRIFKRIREWDTSGDIAQDIINFCSQKTSKENQNG